MHTTRTVHVHVKSIHIQNGLKITHTHNKRICTCTCTYHEYVLLYMYT